MLSRFPTAGRWLDELLADECADARLSPADRALAQELALGAMRQQALLDWLISRRTDDRPQPPVLRHLLRVGLYQLFLLDRIPDHAAVNETVELAKKLGFAAQSGFVNALLRGCLREREVLEKEIEHLRAEHPDLGHSHPRWLCERWAARFGADGLRTLLAWNNRAPEVYARVNTLKATPAGFRERLTAEGVTWEEASWDWVPEGWVVRLVKPPALTALASFRDGLFYVQDPSTLLAVTALGAAPGEMVLDLCAAPGGKTTAIAQQMGNDGRLTAYDSDQRRRQRIRENCDRLGVTMVRVPEGGPVRPGESFHRILVDAPCSNTGVMRRRAELRWRITEAELGRLCRLQQDLLRQAAGWLKPGGTLVYSTCSLEPEENHDVTSAFLAASPGWERTFERQLSPLTEQVDGAYVAVLRKPSG